MKILDLSAGKRNIWFNRLYPDALFVDIRAEMSPNVVADTRNLPFGPESFDLVVFDPPHMVHGASSTMADYYGRFTGDQIKDLIRLSSLEAWRVSTPSALLAFKWNSHDVRLDHVLPLMEGWEPLFGHKVASRSLHRSSTSWVMLRKRGSSFGSSAVLALDRDPA